MNCLLRNLLPGGCLSLKQKKTNRVDIFRFEFLIQKTFKLERQLNFNKKIFKTPSPFGRKNKIEIRIQVRGIKKKNDSQGCTNSKGIEPLDSTPQPFLSKFKVGHVNSVSNSLTNIQVFKKVTAFGFFFLLFYQVTCFFFLLLILFLLNEN